MWKAKANGAAYGPYLFLLSVLLLCLFICSAKAATAAEFPSSYDSHIRMAVGKWWPDVQDWKLWKSQLYAESRLNPDARSPVGAEGVAQFMDKTWQDAIHALGWPGTVSRRDAQYAIEGGAWYMRKLRAGWKPRGARTPLESHWLAAASYNRGMGNVIKDQAECMDALLWKDISVCTARHTMETLTYVKRITQYRQNMELDR